MCRWAVGCTVACVHAPGAGADPRAHQGQQRVQQLELAHEGGEVTPRLRGDQRQLAPVGALHTLGGRQVGQWASERESECREVRGSGQSPNGEGLVRAQRERVWSEPKGRGSGQSPKGRGSGQSPNGEGLVRAQTGIPTHCEHDDPLAPQPLGGLLHTVLGLPVCDQNDDLNRKQHGPGQEVEVEYRKLESILVNRPEI